MLPTRWIMRSSFICQRTIAGCIRMASKVWKLGNMHHFVTWAASASASAKSIVFGEQVCVCVQCTWVLNLCHDFYFIIFPSNKRSKNGVQSNTRIDAMRNFLLIHTIMLNVVCSYWCARNKHMAIFVCTLMQSKCALYYFIRDAGFTLSSTSFYFSLSLCSFVRL